MGRFRVILVIVILAGCAPNLVWVNKQVPTEKTDSQFKIDNSKCKAMSYGIHVPPPTTRKPSNTSYSGNSFQQGYQQGQQYADAFQQGQANAERNKALRARAEIYDGCMLEKGWTLEEEKK